MIRFLALALILLVGCATTKPPQSYAGGYTNADNPCFIINERLHCIEGTTEEARAKWLAYHVEPSLDECEQKALTRHKWAAIGDSVTTIAVLGLCSAIEANPIIAAVPGGWLIVPLSYGVYRMDKWQKSQTSRYQEDRVPGECDFDATDIAVGVRTAVAVRSLGLLGGCL